MAFIVLVAVGADYNMLLISRIRDESPDGMRSGVIRTIRSTGVITSAGMIFGAPMSAMLLSSIGSIVQGELVAVGLATENQAGDAAGRRRRRFDRECQRERQRLKAADSQAVCDAVHDVTKVFVLGSRRADPWARAARLGK